LSEGASEADLLDAVPRLTRDDIHAAMRYAADAIAHEEVVYVGPDPRGARD
jgi:predicted nuclease of predicted toxin-antitoxin system